MNGIIKKELSNAENHMLDNFEKHKDQEILIFITKIKEIRTNIFGEEIIREKTKGCLRCALKSLMNSRIFLQDIPGFSIGSYNQLILDFAEYLQRNMLKT